MLTNDQKLVRELKRHQTLDHAQCEQFAARHGKSVRAVIAKAVASNVTYVPRGQKGLTKKQAAEKEKAAAEIAALEASLQRARLEEASQPFTTGIFHPMAFPILVFILMVAGCYAIIND